MAVLLFCGWYAIDAAAGQGVPAGRGRRPTGGAVPLPSMARATATDAHHVRRTGTAPDRGSPLPAEQPGGAAARERCRAPEDYAGNPARWMFERLATYIKQFESRLDEEHEIGARLVSFGANLTFHIEDMGYFGPGHDRVLRQERQGRAGADGPAHLAAERAAGGRRKQELRARRIGFILDDKATSASSRQRSEQLSKSVRQWLGQLNSLDTKSWHDDWTVANRDTVHLSFSISPCDLQRLYLPG